MQGLWASAGPVLDVLWRSESESARGVDVEGTRHRQGGRVLCAASPYLRTRSRGGAGSGRAANHVVLIADPSLAWESHGGRASLAGVSLWRGSIERMRETDGF